MPKFSDTTPIYIQIQRYFEEEIISERLLPNEKIDSIRNLAVRFKVNPNTIAKALNELERDLLIYTDRTSGKYITDNVEIINELKLKHIKLNMKSFIESFKRLGFTKEDINNLLEEYWED